MDVVPYRVVWGKMNMVGQSESGDTFVSELTPETDSVPSNSEYDFDLYNIIVNAVDYL